MENTKSQIAVRQLLNKNNVLNLEDWRFVRQTNGYGAYTGKVALVARRPCRLSNQELETLLHDHADVGLRLATTTEYADTLRPFDNTDKVYSPFLRGWGDDPNYKDAREAFLYQGMNRGGLVGIGEFRFREPSEDGQIGGIWAVTGEGNRIGGTYNVQGDVALVDHLAARNKGFAAKITPRDQTPRDQTPRDQTPRDQTPRDQTPRDQTPRDNTQTGHLEIVKMAGIAASPPKELESNEGYLLARKPTEREIDYFDTVITLLGPKLSADRGITILTPPDFSKMSGYFIPAGGCADCANQREKTFPLNAPLIKQATGIQVQLPQEVHRYMDIMEERIRKQEFTASAQSCATSITTLYHLTGNRSLVDIALTAAFDPNNPRSPVPKELAEKFRSHINALVDEIKLTATHNVMAR